MAKICTMPDYQIYMGDHMTRQWTKSERERATTENEDGARNSIRRADSQASRIVPSRPSHYSSRKLPNGKRKLKSTKEILMHHNITKEDMLKWQESFDALLNSTAGLYVFTIFLESEIADENLKFWLACEDLKHSKQKKQEKRVQYIYDTFINVYSPHEINIDYKMREDIVEQLKSKVDVSVFTEAQHQVYTLMHRDSYPRFLSSSFKAELMDALSEINNATTKSGKTAKDSSKSSTGLISCCYCRRQDSEQDIANLVEEQHTASTSVANKSMDVPASCDKEGVEVDVEQSCQPHSNPPNSLQTLKDQSQLNSVSKCFSEKQSNAEKGFPETSQSYENPTMERSFSFSVTGNNQSLIDS